MKALWYDSETFSPVPIANGTYAYVEQAEVMIVSYAIDDGPVQVWDVTADDTMPGDLEMALADDQVLVHAHNASFDRTIYRLATNTIGWPEVAIDRWRCTLARALAHSLPGGLDKLCAILGVPAELAKDKEGKKLIHLFCKPQPKGRKIDRATAWTHPEEWAQFLAYAGSDISAMRVVAKKLPDWNYRGDELVLWHRDQAINQRGFAVDLELAEAALRAVDQEQARLASLTVQLTDGQVEKATQRDRLLAYLLEEHGVSLPDLTGATIERRLQDDELPDALRQLLRVRLMATTSSTSKYKALKKSVSRDGRLRGTMQFDGAMRTGRWAHKLFQPGNMPRPTLGSEVVAAAIDALKDDCVDLMGENVMEMASNAIRGCIVAAPGKKLVVSDLSNIEGRGLAYLAGEDWKLDAFRAFDAGVGADIYKLAYARAFNADTERVTKPQRQIGKVMELALGFQGGVGAFVTMVATYGMDLEELARQAWPAIPDDVKAETAKFWGFAVKEKRTLGLPEDIFRTCDALKRLWRRAHPKTEALWSDVEQAAISAIEQPGKRFTAGRLVFRRADRWLGMRLPSGRVLCYPQPEVKWKGDKGEISYMGVNQYTKKWDRIKSYGGKFVENGDQALARDVLAGAMPRIEAAGYPIVLSVHDELLTEPDDTPEFNEPALSSLLATPPAWASDLPLAAAGFEAYRYRKD